MELCIMQHDEEIVHNNKDCPLCTAIDKIEILEKELIRIKENEANLEKDNEMLFNEAERIEKENKKLTNLYEQTMEKIEQQQSIN